MEIFIDAQSQDYLDDYAKCFTLKVVCDDTNSRFLCPTPKVDKIWHAHILSNLNEYIADCTYVLVAFDANFSLTQPKSLWINHRRIDDRAEAHVMSTACAWIHFLVWPREAVAPVCAPVRSMMKRKITQISDEDESEEGGNCG